MKKSLLEEAAEDYAQMVLAVVEANAAGLPYEFSHRLKWQADSALEALKEEAMRHFNNVHDGATE